MCDDHRTNDNDQSGIFGGGAALLEGETLIITFCQCMHWLIFTRRFFFIQDRWERLVKFGERKLFLTVIADC